LAAFDSGKVVEALDYSFEKHLGKGHKGTVREPNDRQIGDYLTAVKKLIESYKEKIPTDVDTSNPAELVLALDSLNPEEVIDFNEKMAGIYAALCSGEPSRDELLGLPMRIRTVFYGWLQQEVMSPEAVPAGGNSPVTTLRSAAAG
jgi:hypothetical protein